MRSHSSLFRKMSARAIAKMFGPSRRSRRRKFLPRPVAAESLEVRMLLSGTPAATLQLFTSTDQSAPAAVTLAVNSFQFGSHLPVANGAATGFPRFDELALTAKYNANSPQLFASLTTGQEYASAVLTEDDAGGKPVVVGPGARPRER